MLNFPMNWDISSYCFCCKTFDYVPWILDNSVSIIGCLLLIERCIQSWVSSLSLATPLNKSVLPSLMSIISLFSYITLGLSLFFFSLIFKTELDYKESWVPKNWCFWTMALEKTPESPLDCQEIQPVHPKGDQSWVFIGRTDIEAETPLFWPPDVKSWLIWKDPDAGKDWRQEEKGTAEDEMVGWHHQLSRHELG